MSGCTEMLIHTTRSAQRVKNTIPKQTQSFSYLIQIFDLGDRTEAQSSMAFTKKGRKRQSVLERGWTSASPQGKKYGQPESNNPDGKSI